MEPHEAGKCRKKLPAEIGREEFSSQEDHQSWSVVIAARRKMRCGTVFLAGITVDGGRQVNSVGWVLVNVRL